MTTHMPESEISGFSPDNMVEVRSSAAVPAKSSEVVPTQEDNGERIDGTSSEKVTGSDVHLRGTRTVNGAQVVNHDVQDEVEVAFAPTKNEENVEAEQSPQTNQGPEDESKYPSGFALNVLTLGLFLATFVVALDNTIIATAIPRITTDFDSLSDVGWYGSAYLLTTTSLQPTFGKIFTYFNVKWTYLFAVFIFEVGSIICATAPNSTVLIVGRAVAGVGASALFSGGMTIIGYSVPLRKRAFYIALLSSTFGIASVVGPLLGGVFTDSAKLTWRFCFWINLPFGALAILTTGIFFKKPDREYSKLGFWEKIAKMDLLGAFLLICAIVCLLLALQWGGTKYPWNDAKVWGCILGFGLLIIIFIALQFRLGDDGTIPPSIMLNRTVGSGTTFSFFLSAGIYTQLFYLPFYFQAIKGTSAEGSGIRTIPYLVTITLASIVVGGLVTTLGPYTPFLWFGAAIFTVGSAMLYTLGVSDGAGRWIGWQILTGIGAGSSVQIPFISVQVALDAKDMPSGNALTIFFNSLGGALSISIAQNIFSNTLLKKLTAAVPPEVVALVMEGGGTRVQQDTPPQYLAAVLQAYDEAVTTAFILPIAVGGLAFFCGLYMPWGTVKGKKLSIGGAA